MSATFRILEGMADIRLDGKVEAVTGPFEIEGIEFDPKVMPKPKTGEELAGWQEKVKAAMRVQLTCPMMGSASTPLKRQPATIEVEAVDEPVFLLIYRDVEQSPHPDETFGQSKGFEEDTLLLAPGESWTGPVCEANAATVLVVTA